MTLPADLQPFEVLIHDSMRQAVVLAPAAKGAVLKPGATKSMGAPDFPTDATWARNYYDPEQSPLDGPSFMLQVDLSDIPAHAKALDGMPQVGVLWLLIDLSEDAEFDSIVHFDPREASTIPWRSAGLVGEQALLEGIQIPAEEIDAFDHIDGGLLQDVYGAHASTLVPSGVPYFGGYPWCMHAEKDSAHAQSVFATMRGLSILDNGAVHIHFSKDKGWWGSVESA